MSTIDDGFARLSAILEGIQPRGGYTGWRIYPDVMRGTVVLLHPTGIWTEFSADAYYATGEPEWGVVRDALNAAAGKLTGRVEVQLTKVEDGPPVATVCQLSVVAMTPDTTDPSQVGWVLDEAARRGFWACLSTSGDWSVTRPGFARTGKKGTPAEAATAILEAMR